MNPTIPSEQGCRSYEDLISQWVFEDNVDEKTLAPVKGHIKTCESCKSLKREYQMIVGDLKQEDLPPAPSTLKKNVMAQINQNSKKASSSSLKWLSIAASLLIIVGVVVMNQGQNKSMEHANNSMATAKSKNSALLQENSITAGAKILENAPEEKLDHSMPKENAKTPAKPKAKNQKKKTISNVETTQDKLTTLVYKIRIDDLEAFKEWCLNNNYESKKIVIDDNNKEKLAAAKLFDHVKKQNSESQNEEQRISTWLYFELVKKNKKQ